MLAWLLFVEDSAVVDQVDFKELGAANKIKLLLHHCGIFLEVPPQLQTLTKTAVNPQSKKVSPGPTVVVEIRNTIIHPHAANAKKFADWLNATALRMASSCKRQLASLSGTSRSFSYGSWTTTENI